MSNIYDQSVLQFIKMLRNLDRWLEAGARLAEAKKFSPDNLMALRLAPDMYSLVQQVQSACDSAKFTAAYLSGKQAPSHPDTEKTMDEARARIRACLDFLGTVTREDFAGAEERKVAPRWLQGKWMRGDEYLVQSALPNFYFHVTTAYDILRHNGVDLGKRDFMGQLPIRD